MSNPSATPWYAIRRKTPLASAASGVASAAEIYIYGDIGESWYEETVSAAQFVRDLNALTEAQITIRINSVGGSVPDGLAIYNAIRRHPATVITEIDGMAFSIASLIAMAGDTVNIASNAMLMIHAPWTYTAGNSAELRELADQLDTWAAAMSTSYAARTGDQPGMLALLTDGKDHYYTAADALTAKLVDAITDPMPVAASAARDLPLNRYRALPAALQAASNSAAAAAPYKEPSMSQASTTTAADQSTVTITAAPIIPPPVAAHADVVAAALASDKLRREAVRASFAPFAAHPGVAELLRACEDDTSVTAAAAGQRLLAHLGAQATPVAGINITTVEDETDKRRDGIVSALLVRAGVEKDAKVRASMSSNPFRGHKLLDLARASLDNAGIKTTGMDQMKIVATAFTQGTSDFPVLLENTMYRALLTSYAAAALTWNRFCATGSVGDFRAHNRYRIGSFGVLDATDELGEFKSKSIPDGEKASITAATKGNIINLSRQAVINDDLGAFVGLSGMLGRAAARTVEVDVYALLALNGGLGPVMADGKTLFHADHGNIGTGAAISMASIDADRVLMASQKDISGNDFLDLRPSVLLLPIGLGGTARSINEALYDPDTANKLQKPNVVNGLYSDIIDTPRMTGTRRYSFADATEASVIEVAFLDGAQDPYLEVQDGFDVDGARYKVRLDYGVAATDYRGAVTNAGA